MAILETLDLSAADRRLRARELLTELGLNTVAHSAAYTLSGASTSGRQEISATRSPT